MTDKELTECAARAVGKEVHVDEMDRIPDAV